MVGAFLFFLLASETPFLHLYVREYMIYYPDSYRPLQRLEMASL